MTLDTRRFVPLRRAWVAAITLLPLLVGLPAAGQTARSPDSEIESLVSPTLHGELQLSLADAVAMGIENNLDLQVERFSPLIAYQDHESTWGAFDPNASSEFGYSADYAANANRLSSGSARTRTRTMDGSLGLDGLLPFIGITYKVELKGDKTDTTQFDRFQVLRPEYNSGMAISGSIPLLKGLIWNEPWTRVHTSGFAYDGSRENFRTELMDIVERIETTYWDLVAAKEAVGVAQKSLETAESLLDQTQTQYEVGVKSKVEVVESEAGVASREFDLIVTTNAYHNTMDRLIDEALGTRLTPNSRLYLVPVDDPKDFIRYEIDVNEAARKAFENRPELDRLEAEIRREEIQLKFAKNQRLPQFDILGSYGVGGKRGAGAPDGIQCVNDDDFSSPTPDSCSSAKNPSTGNLDDTFDDWFGSDGDRNFSVRGVLSIPIGNISARHQVSRRQLELRRAKTRLIRQRQDIIVDVRQKARNLTSSQEGIQAADRRRIAAAEQLRAERVRLEYGESTPFRVLEREEDLVEAENEHIIALRGYRVSVVQLDRAQGTILKARNIIVEGAATLR